MGVRKEGIIKPIPVRRAKGVAVIKPNRMSFQGRCCEEGRKSGEPILAGGSQGEWRRRWKGEPKESIQRGLPVEINRHT